jgi:hypothetical protein
MIRHIAAVASVLSLIPAQALTAPLPLEKLEAAYVLLGGDGPVARVVYTGKSACPSLSLDGAVKQMGMRLSPQASAKFPVLVCELLIPSGTASVMLGKLSLPLPPTTLASAAVLGDTGCRLAHGTAQVCALNLNIGNPGCRIDQGRFQNCTDKWPFWNLARNIAEMKPQVVLHVGDFIYRESPKVNPHGDNWPTWQADFFGPAAPLLAAAPWIAARGNHEICSRAGNGFMLFLDPTLAQNQQPPSCVRLNPHFQVNVGSQAIFVVDSSNASDSCGTSCDSRPYERQFKAIAASGASGAWLLTHRPAYGFLPSLSPINNTLQGALKDWTGKLPPNFALAISGHVHLWEALSFADQRAPQFVIGNGGTELDPAIQGSLDGAPIGGTSISSGKSVRTFGFTMLTPASSSSGWTATAYGMDGTTWSCGVTATAVSCP